MNRPGVEWARDLIAELQDDLAPTGVVAIAGEINRRSEPDIRRRIEQAARAGRLDVLFNTGGGDVVACDRIARHLSEVGRAVPVAAHVERECSSGALGPLLAIARQRRTAAAGSKFVLHPTFVYAAGLPPRLDAVQLRRLADQLEADDYRFNAQLATLALPDHLRERAARFGLTLSGHEAAAYNLIGRVRR